MELLIGVIGFVICAYAVIANDAILSNGKYIGDPTEYSLMEMADNVNLNQQKKLDTDFIRKKIAIRKRRDVSQCEF